VKDCTAIVASQPEGVGVLYFKTKMAVNRKRRVDEMIILPYNVSLYGLVYFLFVSGFYQPHDVTCFELLGVSPLNPSPPNPRRGSTPGPRWETDTLPIPLRNQNPGSGAGQSCIVWRYANQHIPSRSPNPLIGTVVAGKTSGVKYLRSHGWVYCHSHRRGCCRPAGGRTRTLSIVSATGPAINQTIIKSRVRWAKRKCGFLSPDSSRFFRLPPSELAPELSETLTKYTTHIVPKFLTSTPNLESFLPRLPGSNTKDIWWKQLKETWRTRGK